MIRSLHGCAAPAKLNLFLHVVGRRADGYHLLQTVFQLIDRCDRLDFELRDDGAIRRVNALEGVPHDSDLVVRAARLLQQYSGVRYGADITLHKLLPMGGGLGGGSSDAASTLFALNHLWQIGLSRGELMRLGLQLGADVPFFLFGVNAFAEGVGEELHEITTPAAWFVVIEPGVSVPTARIFTSAELTRDSKPVRILDFSGALPGFGRNDLQAVAAGLFPEVAAAIESLGQFGDARMTGSGACVFCAFPTRSRAEEVLASMRGATSTAMPNGWQGWIAQGLDAHPLANLQ